MDELQVLLKQDIPTGKNALLESKNNLKNVAAYCAQNYVQAENKKVALEETKKFTTQSLASVAYQINTLASNMLHMLDIQATQLANMESAINNISQTVDIHKEKVARREIGQLTTNKVVNRAYQIVAPANPDRPVKYVRKPIDYNELDDIGHGVKLSTQTQSGQQRRPSNLSTKKTPSPSMNENGSKRDSLHSIGSAGGYGTLRPVRAPTVPVDFTSNSPKQGTDFSVKPSNVPPPPPGGPPLPPDIPPPPSDMMPLPPMDDMPPPPMNGMPPPPMNGMPPPPMNSMPPPPPMNSAPPPPMDMSPKNSGGSYLPPPPPAMAPPPPSISSESSESYSIGASSMGFDRSYGQAINEPPPPPMGDMLPPPPDQIASSYSSGNSPEIRLQHPSWAPKQYIERVLAIYDYSAENDDELSLTEDQVVYVIRKNDDGWFEGVSNGRTGLFPGNYVEEITT